MADVNSVSAVVQDGKVQNLNNKSKKTEEASKAGRKSLFGYYRREKRF